MIRDRALRSLVVVGLVLLDTLLAIALIGWMIMGVGLSGGMMNGAPRAWGLTVGAGLVALLVLVGVIAALIWALRAPRDDAVPSERSSSGQSTVD
ncbi:MAG: hypothetical protein AB7V44_02165 [Pseudonocardia sp.]